MAPLPRRVEPLRPELYRFCRRLTGSPWDAEDPMARGLVTLGCGKEPPAHPRAWLFRVAVCLNGRAGAAALVAELKRHFGL